MKEIRKASLQIYYALALITAPVVAFQLQGTEVLGQSSYFSSKSCKGCHSAPVVATCNGCHAHGTHPSSAKSSINVAGAISKTSYAPGETVTVTITGGYRTGWFRAVLFDQHTAELARSTGNDSGMGNSATYPATLSAPAPATPGTYIWKVGWYGNQYDSGTYGSGWTPDPNNSGHGTEIVSVNLFTVVAAGDKVAPVVTFTLPATAASLTVPATFSATDNVAVTGYMISTSATPPAASAAGWLATAPASITAVIGSNTFYAWAKDAAGNVSAVRSATVVVSLPPASTPVPSITWRHQGDGKEYGMATDGSKITGGAQFWQEPNPAWQIVGQGDFDGDGVRDLVWQNSITGQVYIMLMSTPTAVKSGAVIYTEPDTNWKIVATGDINGDGKTDLIWWNKTTGQVSALLVNGTTIAGGGQIYTEPDTNWKIVAAADFNGNGKVELLWWNSSTGQVALGQTNGTSASTANLIWYEPDTNWRIAGAGDLDGDGKAEIIWHNKTTGQLYGMQTNGSSVINGEMIYTEPDTNWEIVSVGSYNGDNKADLLWWNQLTGQVYLIPMNSLNVAGGVLLYTEPDTTWRIQGETEWRDNLYGRGVTTTTK
ncbi:MAG: FG-GAP-like repeat-containing protein [Desulfuromonadales bacterium]